MHDLAIAVCAAAAVLSVVVALITVVRRPANWEWVSGRMAAIAATATFAAVSLASHQPALDLLTIATALIAVGVYVYSARRFNSI